MIKKIMALILCSASLFASEPSNYGLGLATINEVEGTKLSEVPATPIRKLTPELEMGKLHNRSGIVAAVGNLSNASNISRESVADAGASAVETVYVPKNLDIGGFLRKEGACCFGCSRFLPMVQGLLGLGTIGLTAFTAYAASSDSMEMAQGCSIAAVVLSAVDVACTGALSKINKKLINIDAELGERKEDSEKSERSSRK